jgi:hypothetical protein
MGQTDLTLSNLIRKEVRRRRRYTTLGKYNATSEAQILSAILLSDKTRLQNTHNQHYYFCRSEGGGKVMRELLRGAKIRRTGDLVFRSQVI